MKAGETTEMPEDVHLSASRSKQVSMPCSVRVIFTRAVVSPAQIARTKDARSHAR
jgi:hypothetical protein